LVYRSQSLCCCLQRPKWNYWNDNITQKDDGEYLMNSNLYQKGYSIMLGVTGGYQFQLSDRWNLDLYATIGTSQSFIRDMTEPQETL
jgi:hypothetical protein